MSKSLTLLMLLAMAITLCSTSQAIAKEPPDEIPELHDGGRLVCNLTAEEDQEPQPEPEPEEQPAE